MVATWGGRVLVNGYIYRLVNTHTHFFVCSTTNVDYFRIFCFYGLGLFLTIFVLFIHLLVVFCCCFVLSLLLFVCYSLLGLVCFDLRFCLVWIFATRSCYVSQSSLGLAIWARLAWNLKYHPGWHENWKLPALATQVLVSPTYTPITHFSFKSSTI